MKEDWVVFYQVSICVISYFLKTKTLMKKFEIILLIVLVGACSKPKTDFLNDFVASETDKTIYLKSIPKEGLDILMATNEVNASDFNSEHKYFFGFKKKLNDEHFLISYLDTYIPQYRFTNKLIGWEDEFYCIYNINRNQVVSKLKVSSSDPVLSSFTKQGNYFVVKSAFFKFIPKESECNHIEIERDSSSISYQIQNNRFVAIK